jgi:hypothetical protein
MLSANILTFITPSLDSDGLQYLYHIDHVNHLPASPSTHLERQDIILANRHKIIFTDSLSTYRLDISQRHIAHDLTKHIADC